MARTLLSTVCVRCGGAVVTDEATRFVQAPWYQVANARCKICDTRYLAILSGGEGMGKWIRDLVYRSTESDHPGDEDTPNDFQVFMAENVTSTSKMTSPHGGRGKVVTIQTIETIVVTPRH